MEKLTEDEFGAGECGGNLDEGWIDEAIASVSQSGDLNSCVEKIYRRAYRETGLIELQNRREIFSSIWKSKNREFAIACAILAHGYNEIIGVSGFEQLADVFQCKKQNVQKMVASIQRQCGLPQTVRQRDMKSRERMRKARKAQLTNEPTT